MKQIQETKKTEAFWKCPNCDSLNDLECKECTHCGAHRTSESEVVEITTDFEKNETMVTSLPEFSFPHFTAFSTKILVIIVTAITTIITLISIFIFLKNLNKVTVTEKYWTYTITIAEQKYVHKTSYARPPHTAENVSSQQVRQEDGWDRTEYQYDILEWVPTETREIRGYNTPPNHQEYELQEGEKLVSRTEDEFIVVLVGSKGTRREKVSKKEWLSYTVGNSYSDP